MKLKKEYITILFLCITIAVAFGVPKPKYQSPNILNHLTIPYAFGDWTGQAVEQDFKLTDDNYNFISAISLRKYSNKKNESLYLTILDAGNFHNPKVCMSSTGFDIKEVDDITYTIAAPDLEAQARGEEVTFKAPAVFFGKNGQGYLVSYWMTIDGRRVDWFEQKYKELWTTVLRKQKVGLMVRVDVPTKEEYLPKARALARNFVRQLSAFVLTKEAGYIFGRAN